MYNPKYFDKKWRCEPYTPVIRITSLPLSKKQALWAGIKTKNPALAALLKDPGLLAIQNAFDAAVIMTETEINTYL